MYTRTSRKKAREARERRALWRAVGSTLIGAACGLWTLAPSALAAPADTGDLTLPDGGKVVSGTVAIDTSAADNGVLNINQSSDKAIINWDSFSIGTGATVNFNHYKDGTLGKNAVQNTAGITLNRVVGSDMSQIYGKINAIGSVILVNQNGILFGAGSEVNAAGIVASTADVDTAKFNKGELKFVQSNTTNNNITVLGSMTASINGDYLANDSAYHQTLSASALNLGNRQEVTGFSAAGNKIMLVADGDVAVGKDAKLIANTETTVTGGGTVGSESFSVGGDSSTRESSVVIRADQNADDVAIWDDSVAQVASDGSYTYNKTENFTYSSKGHTDGVDDTHKLKTAKVYLANTNKIESQNVGVYWDSDVTSAGISNQGKEGTGTALSSIGLSGTASKTFTQKDYTKYSAEATPLKDHVTTSGTITVNTYEVTDATNNTVTKGTSANSGVETTFATLVNNVYQLQAISKRIDNADADNNSYGNIDSGTTYALGTTISAAETAKWQGEKGFDPIGNNYNNFFGNFTGNGGSNTYGIYDLNINRLDEAYVGLFSGTSGSSIWSVSIIDPVIKGLSTVGGIAGQANNSWFDNVTMRKRVADYDGETTKTANQTNVYSKENNAGGIVGSMTDSSVRYGVNGGQVENGIDYVGGIAGTAVGKLTGKDYTIWYSQNKGYYSANEDVDKGYGIVTGATDTNKSGGSAGGIVGGAGQKDSTYTTIIYRSYSNGQVNGRGNVGGIAGQTFGAKTTLSQVYNTNEASTLTTVITDANQMGAGTSKYGKVYERDGYDIGCVGGLVGIVNDGTISESYNAGNVSGYSSVGGLVGIMKAGTIENAYSADNNTVLKTSTNDGEYYGFTYGQDKYTYDQDKQCWYKNGDKTTKLSTEKVLTDAPESGRLYNNRLAYRDATVTVTGDNGTGGGVVGDFAGGTLKNTYAAGKVSSTATKSRLGGIIGLYDTSSDYAQGEKKAESLNFYVTTQNVSGSDVSGLGTGKAVGDGTFTGTGADTLKDVTLWQAQNVSGTTSASVEGAVSWINQSELNATNQDNTWMVYSNSATPTLKCFMNWININRQYVYDGTVHNLKTTDVSNYYGGAFFTNGKGQNVYTSGVDKLTDASNAPSEFVYAKNTEGTMASASDDTSYSSFYQYENSNMWSPQHGYYTDPTAGLIITPKTITATLSGTKVYGQTLKGYYYSDGTSNYIYDANSSKWKVADEDTDLSTLYKLTVKSTNVSGTPLISLIDDDGNAIIEGLTALSLNGQKGYENTAYSATELDDQKLNAGTYTTTTATKLTVDDATSSPLKMQSTVDKDGNTVAAYDNYNYVAKYDANLTVKKADLVITATGSKTYGADNGTTGYTFTNIAQADTADASKDNNGKLKSWDTADNVKITTAANVDNYTLYANAATKNTTDGVTSTDADGAIAASTWVATKTDASGKLVQDNYTLGKGSFQHKDAKGNTVNELTSTNYNIIYVGNASDAQVEAVTGTAQTAAAYLATEDAKTANAYTINPRELKYNITGSHVYGATSIADSNEDYTVEAANAADLQNGDVLADLVTKAELGNLATKSIQSAGITTATHVKRDANGDPTYVYNQTVDTSGWDNDITLANGSLNYNLTAGNLQYIVNPATLTYTAGNYSKNYGETAFTANADNDALTGKDTLTGFVTINGVTETIDTAFDATKGDTATSTAADTSAKANATKVSNYTFTATDEDGTKTDLTAANANVMRDEDGSVAYYDGAVGTSEDAWLNDYNITYVNGSAVINPKSITYTVGNNTKTYGDTTVTAGEKLGGSYTASDLVAGDTFDTSKITDKTFDSKGLDKTAGVGDGTYNSAGGYEITANHADIQAAFGDNYEVTVKSGALTVNPRVVNYKIADNTKVYGNTTADKAYSLEFIGDEAFDYSLVDTSGIHFDVGNNVDGVNGLDAKAGVGEYEISARPSEIKTALGKNFTINSASTTWGTLTVTPKEITYTVADNSKTYGDTVAAKDYSGTFTGLVNGDTADTSKLTQSMYSAGDDVLTATKNAGTYTGVIDFTDADALQAAVGENYTVKVVDGNFVIDQKAIDITIDGNSKTYGATTPDKDFTSTISGLVNGDTVELTQADYTSTGLKANANVGTYDITTDTTSIIETLGTNYKLGTVNTGKLTVNPKNITYTINSAEREFASDNPTFTGGFADGAIENWDTVGTVDAGSYATTTTKGSQVKVDAAGNVIAYEGDIGIAGIANGGTTTLEALGIADSTTSANYNVTVVNGDLKITPVTVYYRPDTVSYYRGSSDIDGTYTGSIVKIEKDGTVVDITEYLNPEHQSGLSFTPVDENNVPVTSGTAKRGNYQVIGSGVDNTVSYKIANDPTAEYDVSQWYMDPTHRVEGENYGLEVSGMAPDEQRQYEGIKDSMEPGAQNGESTFISLSHGGYIPEEARNQLRLLTIEDSGINVTSAIGAIDGITIAPSSYASNNGGGNVLLGTTTGSASIIGANGVAGAIGANGTAGANGAIGANGTVGANGAAGGVTAPSASVGGYRGATASSAVAVGEFRPGDIANNSNDDEDELKKQAQG